AALTEVGGLSPDELGQQIDAAKATCSYLILDVPDQAALATIAQAAGDTFIFCGSSALAEELSAGWGEPEKTQDPLHVPANPAKAVFIASGSLMPQSRDQLDWLKRMGTRSFEFPTGAVVDHACRDDAIESISADAARVIAAGIDAIVHMPNDPETVQSMQAQAQQMGLSVADLGSLVSTTLAEVVARVVENSGVTRLAVAGGETSAAVCARLGIRRFRVWEEIEAGLPSCLALDGQSMLLVLKSGSFGSSDFLAKALRYLHQA
ncbi:MAG TPA: nucleotide-binding domain containing protein, partial [Anaerolineaceae bacterium]|nr:nucleotide-binding domain containing protein [Anaerolineaceae bacterium]